jgi:hypothetical protein
VVACSGGVERGEIILGGSWGEGLVLRKETNHMTEILPEG